MKEGTEKPLKALPDVVFVDLPPVIVSIKSGDSRHLKFHAQLEVNPEHLSDVEKMKPRIMDVLNGYLRAVHVGDLEDSLALMRIRGHLLRRIGIVVGEDRVRDVLVMEFVLN
jgi:flagellar FliL protein